jgi:hypothetical protein
MSPMTKTSPCALLLTLSVALALPACDRPSREPTAPTSSTPPATPPAPAEQPAPADQTACATDVDCTMVEGVCTSWDPVAVASRDAVHARNRELRATAECDVAAPTTGVSVSCDDGRCTARPLEHGEWRGCASDADCVAVQGVCGGWDSASRTGEAAMRASYEELAMRVRCAQRDTPPPSPTCRGGFCTPR